jgi:cytoskeletal protein RodZ
MKIVIYVLSCSAAFLILFYLLSWVQMRAWLRAADDFFNNKITEYLTKFKNKENEEQKK